MAKANAATIDIEYLLARHWRVAGLSEIDHRRYLALWGLGTEIGRELLPEVYNLTTPARLMQALSVGRGRSLQRSCNVLADRHLIFTPTLHDLCRVVVVGLADRYPGRGIVRYQNIPSDWFGSDWFGSDRNTKDHAPQKARPAEDIEQVTAKIAKITDRLQPQPEPLQEIKSKPPSPECLFNYEGVLLGKLRAAWKLRFGSIQHPNMMELLRRCRTRDLSPIALFDHVKDHSPDDPLKYTQALIRHRSGLWPENGDQNYADWENPIIESIPNQNQGNR